MSQPPTSNSNGGIPAHLLPNSNYAAMRANRTLQEKATSVEGKARGRESGPKGLKSGGPEDKAMQECAQRMQAEVVQSCAPCEEA